MKKALAILIIVVFFLTACSSLTTPSVKTGDLTTGDIKAEMAELKKELKKVDDQLNTIALGEYGSGFLDDIIAQLGIDPKPLYFLAKTKNLMAGLLVKQLKKKREDLASRIDYLKTVANAKM